MENKFILSLGTAQDGGFPHVGCNEKCCLRAINNPDLQRLISSIAIIDKNNQKFWIIDISPDINNQLRFIKEHIDEVKNPFFAGIFLTHAHIGHYAGLLNLGLEVMNLSNLPIYVLPRMKLFLENNLIFKQLIDNKHIILKSINEGYNIELVNDISIKPFLVPHRNELSETAGFKIKSRNSSIVYIPDIDCWEDWNISLNDLLLENDVLIIDGTFYTKDEIKERDIKKIPHPSIVETMKLTEDNMISQKNKIYFTHLNHTNKAIIKNTTEYKNIITSGYNILEDKQIFSL